MLKTSLHLHGIVNKSFTFYQILFILAHWVMQKMHFNVHVCILFIFRGSEGK